MAANLLQQAEAAMGRGDLFTAHDLARAGVEAGSQDERFRYLQVLALARMGDLAQARERYDNYGLSDSPNVDVASLGARLLKDAAFATHVPDAGSLLRAAEAYRTIYERTGDAFPGVNAATLFLLSGAADKAGAIAAEVLAKLALARTYYEHASRAEAFLDLGRVSESCRDFALACRASDADRRSLATTLRQVSLLADRQV